MAQPNIVFFFSDQQRWDTCGCYGQPLDVTPNLDRMAREGVRFEHAYTCQPVCGPARACLQTGKYAAEVGCYRNGVALPQDQKTVANWMSELGYDVGYIGKWHLASTHRRYSPEDDHLEEDINFRENAVPLNRRGGFKDYWLASDVLEYTSHSYDGHMFDADGHKRCFPDGRYRADAQTDWVIEYLQNRKTQNPFYLFVSYIEPHHQNDHKHYEGPKGSKEQFKNFTVPGDLEDTGGDWREEYPDYLGCCHSLDKNLGRIREELERQGIADNTIIIYTSDHGSHFCTRNSEYKRSCHDGCTHIPMVIHGPGFTGGKVIDKLVSLIDLPRTILDIAGLEVPAYVRGRSLKPLAEGAVDDWRDEVFLQISESQCGRAIRTKKWKYSVEAPHNYRGPRADVYHEAFLFDLEADPHEKNNLVRSSEHAAVREDLARRLKRCMVEAGEKEPVILSTAG
ncbi:MAG: sulfatase-like hydrolase/transferase [Candidatus Pacebacteria bacterium]|nr:sulfatase-like hydrolase/transferase [Candidatus Paceibacterota bacterium]